VAQLRFGVAGCQRYEDGYFTAYRQIAAEGFDFVFHYGDYIYEYRVVRPGERPLPVVRVMPDEEPFRGVAREGDRGRSTISSFLKHFRRLPHHPHVRASAERWNFSCYSSRLLVYSRCSFPIAPTLTDVALP
jgi:hypothetical protein